MIKKTDFFISYGKFNTGIRTTYTFYTINFIIVKPFSTTNSKLASNSNQDNSDGNNSNSNNSNSDNLNENNSDNGNNSSHVLDDNSSRSNSPHFNSDVDGYETDSNRSYFLDGAEAMADHPATEIPDDSLRDYIKVTADIVRHPSRSALGRGDENLREL